jgi:hypothetical protein
VATLDGSGRQVTLGLGVSVSAPGLRGEVALADVSAASGTRAADATGSREAFDRALDRAQVRRIRALTVSVSGTSLPPPGSLRSPSSDESGIVVDVPDLGPDVAQVLLCVDEGGVTTWNFPVDGAGRTSPTARGSSASVRFVVRSTTPFPDERSASRGVLGLVGRKVIELLTIPVLERAVPPIATAAATHWEAQARRVRVRRLEPGSHRTDDVPDLDEAGWKELAAGRSLWFVHGTFSTTGRMLSGLADADLARLRETYGGRVVAFDHHTIGVDPVADAKALAALVPDGLDLEADVVGYSRGGLVARALAGDGGAPSVLDVRRVVHLATPNHGTALADPERITTLLDRATTLLNLAPDGPVDALASSLAVVLSVVKSIARFGVFTLPGLSAMDPGGDFLAGFGDGTAGTAVHHGVASDYEPVGAVRRFTRGPVGNFVVDRVFGSVANDLVVPTTGVFEGAASSFVVDPARRLLLDSAAGVDHGGYFARPDVMATVGRWLGE